MIYLKCECGTGTAVPGSFIGEVVTCEECHHALRMVAASENEDQLSIRAFLQLRHTSDPAVAPQRVFLAGDAPITVGKADGIDLRLPGLLVSRSHCRFVPDGNGNWTIEDSNSRNGLFVNGAQVASRSLEPGDVIRVGEYELRYFAIDENAAVVEAEVAEVRNGLAFESDDSPFDEYELSEPVAPPPVPRAATSIQTAGGRVPSVVDPMKALGPGPTCPCCSKVLFHGAKICVECGIDVKSGRAILVAQGLDEDFLHVRAENSIRLISWLIPFGLYPIASEARGHKRPYAIWSIAALTLITSVIFFGYSWTAAEDEWPAGSNFMLWVGDPHVEEVDEFSANRPANVASFDATQAGRQTVSEQDRIELDKLLEQLGHAPQPAEEFHAYQLITHAFLHGDLLHIAGNMLFLLVFGTRVNALVGNVITSIVYPILAVAGGIGHMLASRHSAPFPMLGASGAIMGLAGMYLVLFPAYKVHVAIWMRFGLFTGFRLAWKLFAVRGFWVVLFYIAFDVLATVLGSDDGVAHWAHLGGFIVGGVLAVVLLLTRLVNAHGGDLLSVLLGRKAWLILGKPGSQPLPAAVSA